MIKYKNFFISCFIAMMIIFSQWKIGLSTKHAASGTATIFVIEFIIFILSFYFIFIQLILKRKILTSSKQSKFLFAMLCIFCLFYFIGLIQRYFANQSLVGNFLLARIVIEMTCVVLIIDYLEIDLKTILVALFSARAINTIVQYFTLLFGDGQIRGPGNLLDNSVTEYSFLLMLIPIMVYSLFNDQYLLKYLAFFNLLLSPPALILSGSRAAFSVGLFMFFFSIIIISYKKWSTWTFVYIAGYLTVALLSIIFIGMWGSNENKQNLSRSISIPVSIYNKFTPKESWKIDLNKLSKPTQTSEISKTKRNVSQTIELSNDMRYEINTKAKNIILASPKNFVLGTGASSVPALNGNQKPHNFILLYMLPFGLLGTVICFLIIFFPLVGIFQRKFSLEEKLLIIATYLPIIIISTTQPILGTMVICISLLILTSSLYKNLGVKNIESIQG